MIDVSELKDFLPHREPMVWVDQVLEANGDSGTCLVEIKEDSLYLSDSTVRQSSYIEWMAQSFGYINAYNSQKEDSKKKLEKAFLVGFEKVSFEETVPKVGDEIIIKIQLTRVIGPISYVQGIIYSKDESVKFCEAVIKLFAA